jgi:segregation and condensation protein B
MEQKQIKNIVEAVLLAAESPLSLKQLREIFSEEEALTGQDISQAIAALQEDYAQRGIELKEVASGFRVQTRPAMQPWVARLWEEKPKKYSRALLETLALIAYRQPITRGEIEDVRGVSVSSNIIRTLMDREWIRVLGYRDVPGKPAMFGTTRQFLDDFNLKSLQDLPSLAEIKALETLEPELNFTPVSVAKSGEVAAQPEQPAHSDSRS